MSVALLVLYDNDAQNELLPLSPERYYSETVIPFAERHHLIWFPLFKTGIPISTDSLPAIIEEFHTVALLLQNELPNSEYNLLQQRLPPIIHRLEALQHSGGYKEIYIG